MTIERDIPPRTPTPSGFPSGDGFYWSVDGNHRDNVYGMRRIGLVEEGSFESLGYLISTGIFSASWELWDRAGYVACTRTASASSWQLAHHVGLVSEMPAECIYCNMLGFDVTVRTVVSSGMLRQRAICDNCLDAQHFEPCGQCGHFLTSGHRMADGSRTCAMCWSTGDFRQCTMCRNGHRADVPQCCEHRERCYECDSRNGNVSPREVCGDQRSLCDSCFDDYEECVECEDLTHRSNLRDVSGVSGRFCYSCVSSGSFNQCECGDWWDPESVDYCCESTTSAHIRYYSYKPQITLYGDGPVFYGMEVEICTTNLVKEASIAANGFGDLVCLKEDSSISNGGFEIVTQPMSYEWARENFSWQTFTDLAKAGSYADDSTGIHVHVSRAGFTNPLHDHRWFLFVHRSKRQMQALARRESSRWAAFNREDRRRAKDIMIKKERSSDRYVAINTQNRDTYEVRIFASSVDPKQIQAAMGLVAASVEYTRQLTARTIIRDNGWAWSSFVAWVEKNDIYAPLLEEMRRLDVIS